MTEHNYIHFSVRGEHIIKKSAYDDDFFNLRYNDAPDIYNATVFRL